MPVNKDLSVAPFFDDFSANSDYVRVLFKPGVSVQTRELNQLQSILQNQIEKFGDQIFKNGTIISGVGFAFNPAFSYAKLLDADGDGNSVDPSDFVDFFVKNDSGVIGIIQDGVSGFESQNPDLNTIYVRYIESSSDFTKVKFAADEILTVYSNSAPIEKVVVNNGGAAFANSDAIVFLPALSVNVSSGSFSVGANIHQTIGANTANAVIVLVANDSVSNNKILTVRPHNADLSNSSLTAQRWTFANNNSISTDSGSNAGNIEKIYGTGAGASIITDGSGIVQEVVIDSPGSGYYVIPYVTIKSNSTAVSSSISLTARNYKALVTVANNSLSPIGNGYAFSVTEGIVYQEGLFLNVKPQRVIVTKYSDAPDGLIAGLEQKASIVDSTIDTSLLDNAIGSLNETAPGADRLKVVPTLNVVSNASVFDSNTFFTLVEWNDGQPTKQFKTAQYSGLGDEMARRTLDSDGSFVVNPFLLGTEDKSPRSANVFNAVIDPGLAYVNGYRVETFFNATVPCPRGLDTANDYNKTGSFNFGNFIRVNELGGQWTFKQGDLVYLRDVAIQYVTAAGNGNTTGGYANLTVANTTAGNTVGTARIRSVAFESGINGTNTAVYELYLFDVNINSGFNFKNTKSITVGNTITGVADLVLEKDSTGNNVSIIRDSGQYNTLLFPTGHEAIKSVNNITYQYKTSNTFTYANNGVVTITLTGGSESHPYTPSSNLTLAQLETLTIVPTTNLETATISATLTLTQANSSVLYPYITTNGTWPDTLRVGDYFRVVNSSANTYTRVDGIINTTAITVSSNVSFGSGTGYAFRLPANVPIPRNRTYRYASLDGTGKTLTLNLPTGNSSTNTTATANVFVVFNVNRSAVVPTTKNVSRNVAIKVVASNNVANTVGPWSLGIPDLFRLKGVFKVESDTLASITVVAGGISYANGESLTFSGGGGSGAAGTITTLANGAISSATLTAAGSGYSSAPTVGVTTAGGSGASLTAVLNSATTVNTNSTNVTGAFFIDSGQKSGYYNLARLIKSPKRSASSVTVTANSVLLIIADTYTVSSFNGYFDLNSYNVNDTTALANSTSTINTVEIPEYQATTDVSMYYDLRDSLDFRPYVANTATVTNTVSSATVNPSNAITFDSNEKFWPVPDATYTYGVQYYLGHSAKVTLDEKGNFIVLNGDAAEKYLPPPEAPPGTMVINNMIVPPYPSIPQAPDSDMISFLNKRIGNSTGEIDVRRLKYSVKIPETVARKDWQPVRYTMYDIGILDQRIKVLEYYTSLSLLESQVLDRAIPSSANVALGRFKNGFFVDGFDDLTVSDAFNPEFKAEVNTDQSVLEPDKKSLKLEIQFNLAPFYANGAPNITSSWITSINKFDEDGNELGLLDRSANDVVIGYTATMPFTEVVAVSNERGSGSTQVPIQPFKFSGTMKIHPRSIDIVGRVRKIKK
jgi:hypothetical protein